MAIDGVQLKVKFPQHLYDALERDSADAGVPIASVVRMAVAAWYRRKAIDKVLDAQATGVITAQETLDRLVVLNDRGSTAVS